MRLREFNSIEVDAFLIIYPDIEFFRGGSSLFSYVRLSCHNWEKRLKSKHIGTTDSDDHFFQVLLEIQKMLPTFLLACRLYNERNFFSLILYSASDA